MKSVSIPPRHVSVLGTLTKSLESFSGSCALTNASVASELKFQLRCVVFIYQSTLSPSNPSAIDAEVLSYVTLCVCAGELFIHLV